MEKVVGSIDLVLKVSNNCMERKSCWCSWGILIIEFFLLFYIFIDVYLEYWSDDFIGNYKVKDIFKGIGGWSQLKKNYWKWRCQGVEKATFLDGPCLWMLKSQGMITGIIVEGKTVNEQGVKINT